MSTVQKDMSLTGGGPPEQLNSLQKIGTIIGMLGLIIILLAGFNFDFPNKGMWLSIALIEIIAGVVLFAKGSYGHKGAGIKNDGVWFKSISSRGLLGWIAGIAMTGFYVILYFYEEYLGAGADGAANTGIVALFDPLSYLLNGHQASQWFVYGTLYTVAILAFGIKFLWKYRHNRYERIRTLSVMFFQTGFAFLIPEIMAKLNPETHTAYFAKDIKNMWPLNYYLFDEWHVNNMISGGNLGMFMLVSGVALIFVGSPILTYFYGKRWYCSWVCGCGGLAETAGDPFRQLSDKSMFAWKVERWVIHSVLVFAVVMTTAVVSTYLGYDPNKYWFTKGTFLTFVGVFLTLIFALVWFFKREELKQDARYGVVGYFLIILSLLGIHFFSSNEHIFIFKSESIKSTYGFLIGAVFSGVIGTGFYPIFGNRVWCRFGCPMAAILGLQQRFFSRFRITTNGGQCISCGNCSTYCEMGIDVKWYAQRGQNIVRSSCVGCGICSAVCPRGVLKLENGPQEGRFNDDQPITFGNEGVDLKV